MEVRFDSIRQLSSNQSLAIEKLKRQVDKLRTRLRFSTHRQENYVYDALTNLDRDNRQIIEISNRANTHGSRILSYHLQSQDLQVIIEPSIEEVRPPILVVSRADFVAGFLGQTALKTLELLNSARGKVLCIDEAYSLYNGSDGNDSFGMEALTTLNKFLSEHPDEIIVNFIGYQDLLDKTIFAVQPGLKSRCMFTLSIPPYSPTGLSQIFINQLTAIDLQLADDINIAEFFTQHYKYFSSFGRDTERLTYYCMLAHAADQYDKMLLTLTDQLLDQNTITFPVLNQALDRYRQHTTSDIEEKHLYYFT